MTLCADPKEVKRQRDRERYAQNKDEINKRRREAYKQKKIASAEISGAQTQLGVSQGNKDELHSSLYILLYINDLFFIYSGSNEIMNRLEREWYARYREEILKRQRQTREQNKHIAAVLDGSNIVTQVPATGQSAVTQLQNITSAGGAVPNSVHLTRDNVDDESHWLHRNDAYQMQRKSRQLTPTQMSLDENPQLSAIDKLHMPEESSEKKG